MPSDAVRAVMSGGVPGPLSITSAVPPGGFAALLDARTRAPEDLPTLTFGEMTGLSPGATSAFAAAGAPPAAAAAGVATVGAAPGAAAAPASGASRMTWPIRGRITSEFGPRVHPVTGASRDHHGLDIAAPTGTPIGAAADGRVTFAGRRGGYGNVVIIDHGNGVESRYAHQDTMSVSVGQRVRAGQRIGRVGSTGLSTGPHLHFEVRRDADSVDPRRFLH